MENVSRYARLIKCKVIQLDRNTCCIFYGNDLKIVSTNSFHFFYLRVGNGAKVCQNVGATSECLKFCWKIERNWCLRVEAVHKFETVE
jgi:hypothetical protein